MTIYTSMGYPHIIAAIVAYIAAFAIFAQAKGGSGHKLWGKVFAAAMLTVATTGVLMYFESGRLSVFYVFAGLIYLSISRGIFHIRRYVRGGNREDLFMHYREMVGAFMGLNLAGIAQLMRLLPFESFGAYIATIMVIYIPLIAGTQWLIRGPLRRQLAI